MGKMPDDCNTVIRLDKSVDYVKHNCKWGKASQGRPRTGEEKPKKRETRRRRIKNPKTLCLNIEQAHYDYINKMAKMKFQQEGVYVEVNDLIREALQKHFPCPELFDLFGKAKR